MPTTSPSRRASPKRLNLNMEGAYVTYSCFARRCAVQIDATNWGADNDAEVELLWSSAKPPRHLAEIEDRAKFASFESPRVFTNSKRSERIISTGGVAQVRLIVRKAGNGAQTDAPVHVTFY